MDNHTPYCNPEIWGGIECTINRVGNKFFDQLRFAGHYQREGDIEQIATLGIKKLRYPILWEKHQPEKDAAIDWGWTQKQLQLLKQKNIDVIAGLVHHGSGPAFTNLLDDNFPLLLADYAKKVAQKFPWIQFYTPVNEPLTTARFSGLYGLWYPHKKSAKAYLQMLLHQLKGVVLSMREIRKINPAAQLIQTEDLGKTYSTEQLKYQAYFENERRWITFDILCGKLNEQHYLWQHFKDVGIAESDLHFFLENPCVPDVFGFNHYLTSERYLDENLELYPKHTHGGNAQHRYADVEAVRVSVGEKTGIEVLLKEAWERYGQPIAITEVHLHCHREEQLRWFKEVYEVTGKLKKAGVQIRAVTTWALLGAYGWNKLLIQDEGDYEPGAFDVRCGDLRPTALAKFIKDLSQNKNGHPILSEQDGWWRRNSRLIYGPPDRVITNVEKSIAPLLIIGKNGTLGRALAKVCKSRSIPYHLLSRNECDITNLHSIEQVVATYRPWAIINAAGYVKVDEAENNIADCIHANTTGSQNLAITCNKKGLQLVSFSSDLVFDGEKSTPYIECDIPNPLNVYGKSKADAEAIILKEFPSSLIIRTSAFFSPWDEFNFVHHVRKTLSQFQTVTVANDIFISPTYVPHLVNTTLDLLIDSEKGIWHLANKGSISWSGFANMIADHLGLDKFLIQAVNATQINYAAKRPLYSVLGSQHGQQLPSFEQAMHEYLEKEKRYVQNS